MLFDGSNDLRAGLVAPTTSDDVRGARQRLQPPVSRLGLLILAAGAVVIFLGLQAPTMAALHALPGAKRKSLSVIMTADPGGMVGLGECDVIEAELKDTWLEPDGLYFCDRILHGTLYGQPVLLVTTGIGHDHASVCMSDLLRVFEVQLKDIFFLGTAGFSPRRGGVLDPDHCGSDGALGGGAADDALVTLGDVCVSPWSTNWDCQRCVWSSEPTSGTVCQRPLCSMHGREDLFGELVCTFWGSERSNALADEVYAAAESAALPTPPDALMARITRYWEAMGRGTGKDYLSALRRTNKALDYRVCSELSSNTFWSGAPFDYLAREYVARLTNLGMRQFSKDDLSHHGSGAPTTNGARATSARTQRGPSHAPLAALTHDPLCPPPSLSPTTTPSLCALLNSAAVTALDTVAVSAMEATGWQAVLFMRELYHRGDPIPFVNLRAAADYTHAPVRWDEGRPWSENMTQRVRWPAWRDNEAWLPKPSQQADFMAAGYRHAIRTSSALVLHVFRLRAAAAISS